MRSVPKALIVPCHWCLQSLAAPLRLSTSSETSMHQMRTFFQYLHSLPLWWLLIPTLFTDSVVFNHKTEITTITLPGLHIYFLSPNHSLPCVEAPRKLISVNVISFTLSLQLSPLQSASLSTACRLLSQGHKQPLILLLWTPYFKSCLNLILLITSFSSSKFCSLMSLTWCSPVLGILLDISTFGLPCWLFPTVS